MATTATQPPLEKVGVAKTSDITHSHKLEDQASTAALYVAKPVQGGGKDANRFMDGDKLSSAGAAASLKYANPKDLPSYPSAGLRKDDSAAGAAASLGWSNQKTFEHWKPDGTSSSASKAALLAKDYKAPPIWQPDGTSSAASKAAMLAKDYKAPPLWTPGQSSNAAKASVMAHRDGKGVEIWRPEATAWGNSAATQAMRSEREHTLSPQLDYGYTEVGRKGSVLAATGAMSGKSGSRRRSGSTPIVRAPLYPDEANATANALSAATHANAPTRQSKTDISKDSGSSPFVHMPKEMFTSAPPVKPEVDEKSRADVLHASAVALARSMYTVQQRKIEEARTAELGDSHYAANAVQRRRPSTSTVDDEVAPMRFNSLQEAAQRLAQERLAKLHDEHAQNREYRNYYGDNQPKSRLSIRGRPHRRASSDGQIDDDYEAQKIRSQMSLFSSNLSQVDAKKRQSDRDALMAAAQRNVTARLSLMDEKAARDPSRMSQSKLSDWEVKAHAAAQKNSDSRMANHGRIDIGGGQFVNQSAVDLVARNNVQPVLDEINENNDARLEREAALKMEMESKHRAAENEKLRQKEVKDINKKLAQQDKEEQKAKRAEEKAREKEAKAELKRAETERKRKSREPAVAEKTVVVVPETTEDETVETEPAEPVTTEPTTSETVEEPVAETRATDRHPVGYAAPTDLRTSMELQQQERLDEITNVNDDATPASPSKSKGWRRIFSRREKGKSSGSATSPEETSKPFVGGAALTGRSQENVAGSRHSSIYDATPVATNTAPVVEQPVVEEDRGRTGRRSASPVSSISALSESSREDEFAEAQDHFEDDAQPKFPTGKATSPSRPSKFTEVV